MVADLINWALLFALIAVVFIIWRSFVRLAEHNNRRKWPFGVLGIVIFVVGINIGVVAEYFLSDYVTSGLLRLPFGIIASWCLYGFLKAKWTIGN